MSHREKGDEFAKRVGEHLCREGKLVKPEYSVEIGFRTDSRKRHSFDFGNETTLVECKNYDWTKGGNNPSAKISTLNESMQRPNGGARRERLPGPVGRSVSFMRRQP